MLEILSPIAINRSSYRERLAKAGIKGGRNYVLDHAWLFENIDQYVKNILNPTPVILDVGCGNSMLHPFLEYDLDMGIIGIDRIDGLCPHPLRTNIMDFCVDFLEFSKTFENTADVVYWLSSIEHNTLEQQKLCVEASLRVLKPGGLFLATFGHSPETNWFDPSEQLNLSASDAELVMGVPWKIEPQFEETVEEYKLDLMELDSRHRVRYGTSAYTFIVAGVSIVGESV